MARNLRGRRHGASSFTLRERQPRPAARGGARALERGRACGQKRLHLAGQLRSGRREIDDLVADDHSDPCRARLRERRQLHGPQYRTSQATSVWRAVWGRESRAGRGGGAPRSTRISRRAPGLLRAVAMEARLRRWVCASHVAAALVLAPHLAAAGYALVGWNNLGMHCMDADFSVFSHPAAVQHDPRAADRSAAAAWSPTRAGHHRDLRGGRRSRRARSTRRRPARRTSGSTCRRCSARRLPRRRRARRHRTCPAPRNTPQPMTFDAGARAGSSPRASRSRPYDDARRARTPIR